jgi:hypothetical protein
MTTKTRIYRYEPVLFDMFTKRAVEIPDGARLVKTQPFGCPKNGTMGMCYVEDADTGGFYGLVMLNSLVRA